jgi:hypothetical protein
MQRLKQYVTIVILMLCFFISTSAQDSIKHKIKIYKTWITLIKPPASNINGYLHEIKDSSILISNSPFKQDYLAGNSKITSIDYRNIDLVKTRRLNNIGWGALIGSSTGFVVGATVIGFVARGMGFLTTSSAIFGGFVFAVFGAGTGSLVGSIKDRIPIHGNYANFNLYRSALQDNSYVQEYPAATSIFEHKGFAGIEYGPSFPFGDFLNKSMNNGNTNIAQTGYCSNFFIGYRLTKRFGLSFSEIDNTFSISNPGSTSYWELGGLVIEPLFTFPVENRLYFDLKPGIGYANAFLVEDDIEKKNGNGIEINCNASLTFNFSKRWGLLTETGFLFTHQIFDDKSKGNFQVFNLSLGIACRFSRKSL